jgi:hypothetical protein
MVERGVRIPIPPFSIQGTVTLPDEARGLVLLAQGSAASTLSWRDRLVLDVLMEAGIGSARLDLLMHDEGEVDEDTHLLWTDIHFLAGRLVIATDWLAHQPDTGRLPLGYLGPGASAAVALAAASERSAAVRALVSRCGRPDLIQPALPTVTTPTLLVVRGADPCGVEVNRRALDALAATDKELRVIASARRPVGERGEMEEIARLARDWFVRFVPHPSDHPAAPADRWTECRPIPVNRSAASARGDGRRSA